jgi:hypothetical protein
VIGLLRAAPERDDGAACLRQAANDKSARVPRVEARAAVKCCRAGAGVLSYARLE